MGSTGLGLGLGGLGTKGFGTGLDNKYVSGDLFRFNMIRLNIEFVDPKYLLSSPQ